MRCPQFVTKWSINRSSSGTAIHRIRSWITSILVTNECTRNSYFSCCCAPFMKWGVSLWSRYPSGGVSRTSIKIAGLNLANRVSVMILSKEHGSSRVWKVCCARGPSVVSLKGYLPCQVKLKFLVNLHQRSMCFIEFERMFDFDLCSERLIRFTSRYVLSCSTFKSGRTEGC